MLFTFTVLHVRDIICICHLGRCDKDDLEFPLRTRSGEEVLSCVKHWVTTILPMYPGSNQLQHYHADGGAELIDQKIKSYLHQTFGTTVTSSSTIELHLEKEVSDHRYNDAFYDCWLRSSQVVLMGRICDCIDIVRMMPTRTYLGWMTPAECVPGGQTPKLSRLRRWGCEAHILVRSLIGVKTGRISDGRVFYRVH